MLGAMLQVTLTALSGYSVPSDNITMCSMAATKSGRIFLGGADGNVHEVLYGKNGRCRRVCQTASFLQLLPSYIPYWLGMSRMAVDTLVVDNERSLLYVLSHNSSLQVRTTDVMCFVCSCSTWVTQARKRPIVSYSSRYYFTYR